MTNAENAFTDLRQSGYRTKEALKYIQRAAGTLNMSHIPSALHEDVGFESTLQLKMILDNIDVPDLNTIPEAKDFKGSEDLFWRIPHTDITRSPDQPMTAVPSVRKTMKLVLKAGHLELTNSSSAP
jgi:hypothetical protein